MLLPELEFELDEPLEEEPLELLPALFDPEPVVPPFELEDGVVELEPDEPDVEPEPEFPVPDVVAALATSAPPATRPEVSAPTASALRRRICMMSLSFVCTDPLGSMQTRCASDLGISAQCRRGVTRVT